MSAEEVLQLVPGLQRHAQPEPEQFANVASTALTLDQWVQLARRVNDLFNHDAGVTAAVITSGTDSLEELAYFLHLTVKTTKPVVLVGAMRNAGALGFEGPANLLDAFRVAAAADSRNKGVLVVLNDEINSAREVAKTDALRVQTFQSRPYGILGVVDPDRVVYYRDPVKRHTQRTEFDISTVTSLPRVDIMMFYQGASSDLLRAAVDAGAKGIVIAVAGADLTGGSLGPGISYAERRRVVVVAATRTGSGRIAAMEIMLNSPLISDLIFKGEVAQIKEVMGKSNRLGMKTFDQSLFDLYESGMISYEDALRNADSKNEVRLRIKLESKRESRISDEAGNSLRIMDDEVEGVIGGRS